ncbi:unnamed protein product [Urochloa decumbens]|uniref:Uncharacterized protein n=1 Tax=Urochloa decumbens TaxID=240449 RepID=A0ABC9DTA5_9POAL
MSPIPNPSLNPASIFRRLDLPRSRIYSGCGCCCGGGGGETSMCTCDPSDLEDQFQFPKRKVEIEKVLAKIEKIYSLVNLPEAALQRCSCVGLLAPTTNIIVNSLMCEDGAALLPEGQEGGGMIQRSLDGLIAFLTCLFPYLPDAEALAYLDAADVDPLVAARLIVNRRGLTRESSITDAGIEISLRSAAVVAQHPDPERFMRGWKLVSLCPQEYSKLTFPCQFDNKEDLIMGMYRLNKLVDGTSTDQRLVDGTSTDQRLVHGTSTDLQHKDLWELAGDRRRSWKGGLPSAWLPPARATMKRLLLSMIHGFYLKALGALPKEELTDWCHRGLLLGGHCYGPLDPVSNIIVNTIWYEQTAPGISTLKLSMISTDCLWRIAARSLYGLVSFLRSRYPNLTPDQALQRLLEARAQLSFADPLLLQTERTITSRMLRKEVGHTKPCATLAQAYVSAATAAFHPSPLLQKDFLGTPDSVRNLVVISEMLSVHDGQPIPKKKFECLSILLKCPSSVGMSPLLRQGLEHTRRVSRRDYIYASLTKHKFWDQHERVSSMVTAVLDKYNETVPKYSFHVICGVNELVDREFCLDPIRCYDPSTPCTYHYSHINFLATREGSSSATLFFAECSNHGASKSWCVPVPLQPDAGISTMAYIHPESRPSVGTCPETGAGIHSEADPDAGIRPDAGMRQGPGIRPEAAGPGIHPESRPDAGAGIHSEADTDAGIYPGAGIHSESGSDAGAGIHRGAEPERMRRGPGIRPEAGRCIYCENEGYRILHPILNSFHGRDDFKELSGGGFYTNDLLIKRGGYKVDWVYGVGEDAIYYNYCVDSNLSAADGDEMLMRL